MALAGSAPALLTVLRERWIGDSFEGHNCGLLGQQKELLMSSLTVRCLRICFEYVGHGRALVEIWETASHRRRCWL